MFAILVLSLENQVAFLILQVAYLVGKSVKIFWLAYREVLIYIFIYSILMYLIIVIHKFNLNTF